MIKIAHRINTIDALKDVPRDLGIECDIRSDDQALILHHDPFQPGVSFDAFMAHYQHRFIILNTKSEGLESAIMKVLEKYNVSDYFFLDLSLPFLIKFARKGWSDIAIRYSVFEPVELALKFKDIVKWVWVDCFNGFDLDDRDYEILRQQFKLCLVSPELQGNPVTDIQVFKERLAGRPIDAVCTKRPDLW